MKLRAVLLITLLGAALARAEGPEVVLQMGNRDRVEAVALSADSRFALSSDMGGNLVQWDFHSGRQIRYLVGHTNLIRALATSPGGSLALSGSWDHTLRLWDLETGACLRTFTHPGSVDAVAFTGPRQALSAGGDADIRLWNLATGERVRTFTGHSGSVVSLTCAPDGKSFVSGADKELKLWSLATGKCLRTFPGTTSWVTHEAFSPDGRTLAACGDDGVVRFWDVATGRVLRTFPASDLESLSLSPDGRRLFTVRGLDSGGHEHALEVRDAFSGQVLRSMPCKTGTALFLAGGQRALSGSAASHFTMSLWDLKTGKELRVFGGNSELICGVSPSIDGRKLLTGSADNSVLLWDLEAGGVERILRGHTDHVKAVALSGDGTRALSAAGDPFSDTTDFALKYWDTTMGRELNGFRKQKDMITTAVLSPDGRRALSVTIGLENAFRMWDVDRPDEVRTFPGHARTVNAAVFTPDGARILSASLDGTVKLWNAATAQVERTFNAGAGSILCVAPSPDGRLCAAGGIDHAIRVWNLATGALVATLRGHGDLVRAVRFSPDGHRLLSGGGDRLARLWDLDRGEEIRPLKGHLEAVNDVAFAPDGLRAYTSSRDGTVRVWDLASGRELAMLVDFKDGEWIVLTPAGYFNASSNGAGHVNVRMGSQVCGVDQFYARFFRPELVRLAMAGRPLPSAESFGDIMAGKPAPRIRILSPAQGLSVPGDTVTVTVDVADAGGGVGSVNLYLNGAQVANGTRGIRLKAGTSLAFTIPLVEGVNEIRAVAFNRDNSMESAPATVTVVSGAARRRPDLHVLAVGINDYRNASITLKNAVADATAFAATLKEAAAPLFGQADVVVLTTPEATTREAITRAFRDLAPRVKPNDVFVFFDASHGLVDVVDGEEQYLLLTSDALLLSSRHVAAAALSQRELAALVGSIPAQKKLVVLDTCNAGKGGKEIQVALLQQTRGLTDATAVKLLQRSIGSAVFSASSDTQSALEGYRGHGLFTYVLLEGLKGGADLKKDGFITVLGLADYVEGEVVRLSEEVFRRQQTPTIETGANFPIGKVH